jgi:sulfur-oxidizing protein SoxY
MDHQRRRLLRAGGGLGIFGLLAASGLLAPQFAHAGADRRLFAATSLAEVLAVLGAERPAGSVDIQIGAADIAENGALVPVSVTSAIPATEQIVLMIEKNPNMVAATFTFPDGTFAEVHTRVKMAETSDIYALVRADGRLYVARKAVRVTLGGCIA